MGADGPIELGGRSIGEFLDLVGARSPTPGGGSVAGVVAALAAALAQMVGNYSLGRKDLAAHEPALRDDLRRLARARELVLQLGVEDMAAYGLMNDAMRLPKDDLTRADTLASAAMVASRIPQAMAAACCDLLRLFLDMSTRMNRNVRSDLAIGAILAEAVVRASQCNIALNLPMLPGDQRRRIEQETSALLVNAAELLGAVEKACV